MSSAELNDALNAEMSKPGYQSRQSFKELDAEMTRREDKAQAEINSLESKETESQAAPAAEEAVASETTSVADGATVSEQSKDSTGAEAAPTVEGTLSVMSDTSPADKPYTERNLVADNFTQSAGREDASTQRPLVAMKDFLSTGWDSIMKFVVEKTVDKAQLDTLNAFFDTAAEWAETIRKNLPARKVGARAQFRRDDMMQFLLTEGADGKSDVDENVKTAIAAAAYTWAASEATAPLWSTQKSINSILGRGSKTEISPDAMSMLGKAGVTESLLVDTLGAAAYAMLGVKLNSTGSAHLEATLKVALGQHAHKLLEDKGMLTRTTYTGAQMAELREEGMSDQAIEKMRAKAGNPKARHHFFAVARNESGTVVAGVQEIFEASKGSKGILDKLFGSDKQSMLPSLEPITEVQGTTLGTKQGVPEEQRKGILASQSRGWSVQQDPVELLGLFDDTQIDSLIGVVSEDEKDVHLVNLPGVQAKNAGLRREWASFKEWTGESLTTAKDGLSTPFYLAYDAWKQQRTGMRGSTVNPQTSKVVRQLIGLKEWETTLDPASPEYEQQLNTFYVLVAQGLKVKVDRADDSVSIAKVQAMLEEPVYAEAVAALVNFVKQKQAKQGTKLSDAEKASIVAAVGKGKEKLHSLVALLSVAQQQAAVVDGVQQPFTISLMGEADGVSNGTMFNLVLFGAGDQATLNRGGFFEVGNEDTQYNQWRGRVDKPGNRDIYETVARKIYDRVQGMFDEDSAPAAELASIWEISGHLFLNDAVTAEGRDLVKGAINPIQFGSALDNMVRGMANTFLGDIYAGFETRSKEGASQAEIDAYVGYVNRLINDPKHEIPTGNPIKFYMDFVLSPQAMAAIRTAFIYTVGEATTKVMEEEFSTFLQRSKQMNRTADLTYGMYAAVRKGMREAYVEELLAKNELPKTVDGRLADLSKQQEAELEKRLRKVMPVVQTSMSMKDKEDKNSGLLMAKTKRQQSSDPIYENKGDFGTAIPDLMAFSTKLKKWIPQTSTNTAAIVTVSDAPGVVLVSAGTHSFDSGLLLRVQAKRPILGLHDALGDGVGGLVESTAMLNQETWLGLLNYSPMEQAYQAMVSVVSGIADLQKSGQLSPQAVNELMSFLSGKARTLGVKGTPNEFLQAALMLAKTEAFSADTNKFELMKNWASVSQYAFQGGNYLVTKKDRAEAAKRQEALTSTFSPEVETLLRELKGLKVTRKSATTTTPVSKGEELDVVPGEGDVVDALDDELVIPPVAKESPFGEVGTPDKKPNALLSAFFDANPVTTAEAVLKQLASMIGSSSAYTRLLIGMLRKAMPKGVKVIVVTPEMTLKDVVAKPESSAYAWYVDGTIYVIGNGFKRSGLQTPEVMLHELVHAATFAILESTTGLTPLHSLMALAKAHAKAKGTTEFDYGLDDVHEFVAYGMTRLSFQNFLSEVAVPVEGNKTTMTDGFKAFVQRLVGLLFDRFDKEKRLTTQAKQTETALMGLIQEVTAIIEKGTRQQGKGAKPTVLSQSAPPDPVDPNAFSTMDLHDALSDVGVTPDFDNQLRGLLVGITQKLHGPFGVFLAKFKKNQALTAVDIWTKALATGEAPFASSMQVSPLKISERESFVMEQVEATVRAALERKDSSITSAYRQLEKLYDEAKTMIKVSDFTSQDPQAEYDFLFKVEVDGQDKSAHLARFAAFGLAHQQVNSLLKKSTKNSRDTTSQKTLAARLATSFRNFLEYFHEKMSSTYSGQQADQKLERLVGQLVDIEAKKRLAIARKATGFDPMAPIEDGAKWVVEGIIDKAQAAAGSKFVRQNYFTAVQVVGAAARTVLGHRVDEFLEGFAQMRDKQHKERLGFIAGTFNFARMGSKVYEGLMRARKLQEGERKDIITSRSKLALAAFAEAGKYLTKDRKASESITQVFLRTGLQVLTPRLSMAELENLLGNKAGMDAEIAALESQLTGLGPLKNFAINQANKLGYYSVTGINRAEKLMMNAHNIARMRGSSYSGRITEAQARQMTPVLEQLVALYALSYVDNSVLLKAKGVLRTENARTDGGGNGVATVLALHKRLHEESRDRLFQGSEALMAHGYTPEIYTPHVDIVTATDAEGEALMRRGYTKGATVAIDPAHPDQTKKRLYVLEGGGAMRYATGITSMTRMRAKGAAQHANYMNINTADGLANAVIHSEIMQGKKGPLDHGPRKDLSKGGKTFMAPVVNASGDIVNWRYLMHSDTKDSILKRENRFNMVLGTLAGSIYDKSTALELNTKVFEALKDQWDSEKGSELDRYTLIGPNSPDPENRETWGMLSPESKAEAKRIWGKEGIRVKHGVRDIVFGYRKLSISSAITKTQNDRAEALVREAKGLAPVASKGLEDEMEKLMAKVFTLTVEHALKLHAGVKGYSKPEEYAERAAWLVSRGERMWQEIVGETKDLLVIKTITVMLGNIKSNVSFHILSGVPIKDIWKGYVTAYRGATSYQRDNDELARIQTLIDIGQTNGKDVEMRAQVVRLKNAIERNPVKVLIDEGLMPTIVEDAAEDEDPYSYKSALTEKVDRYTSKLHPGVLEAGKFVYMTKDSTPYRTLRHITQLSDFMARYVQYQYSTTRKENPLSHADAIQQSSEDFVNYELPMHRGMQYLDDMGVMPFMKYFLRIQKVIYRLHREHPGRVLIAMLLGKVLDLGPIVLDGSLIHKAGNNPFHFGGPVQYLGALDELPLVNGALSLVSSGASVPDAVLAAQ